MQHKNLTVAPGPRADADGGDMERIGNPGREFRWNAFQHDGKSAQLFESLGLAFDLDSGAVRLPLHVKSAIGTHRLRLHPDMSHDGNAALHTTSADIFMPELALKLQRMSPGAHQD